MTAYQFSQPWLSKINGDLQSTAMEFAHLRDYLKGIDEGSIPLFNPHFLHFTVDALTINGNFTVVGGNLIFSPTTGGILGTTTANDAATGVVGEYQSILQGANTNFPTTGNYGDLLSMSLTAGDWDIAMMITIELNGATASHFEAGVSTSSGTSSTGLVAGSSLFYSVVPTAATNNSISIGRLRAQPTTTTTYYLKYLANYTAGTPQARGNLTARRMR